MSDLKRIILHWTAGRNKPNSTDLAHYHYLLDDSGNVFKGNKPPEVNINCNDGNYVAHTGGGNTGSIGVAMCGMYGFKNGKLVGSYPLTKVQCERCFKLIAELSKKYDIVIDKQHVMTHYEFGLAHPKTSSAGKIDIVYLPPYPFISKNDVGAYIRHKAHWYLSKI